MMRMGFLMSSRESRKRSADEAGESQDIVTSEVPLPPVTLDEKKIAEAALKATREVITSTAEAASTKMVMSSTEAPLDQDTIPVADSNYTQQPRGSVKPTSVTTRHGKGKGRSRFKGRKGRKRNRSAAASSSSQEKPAKTSGLGRGKGPRGGQSHKRARQDLTEEVSESPSPPLSFWNSMK